MLLLPKVFLEQKGGVRDRFHFKLSTDTVGGDCSRSSLDSSASITIPLKALLQLSHKRILLQDLSRIPVHQLTGQLLHLCLLLLLLEQCQVGQLLLLVLQKDLLLLDLMLLQLTGIQEDLLDRAICSGGGGRGGRTNRAWMMTTRDLSLLQELLLLLLARRNYSWIKGYLHLLLLLSLELLMGIGVGGGRDQLRDHGRCRGDLLLLSDLLLLLVMQLLLLLLLGCIVGRG